MVKPRRGDIASRSPVLDFYLCGEVHAITCLEKAGIMQISHGALFGYTEYPDYLTVEVSSNARAYLERNSVAEGRNKKFESKSVYFSAWAVSVE